MAKVSIITATYNSECYIEETINSILSQTFQDWELLITDDCSTDKTMEILQNYESKDSRINVFQLQENGGPGLARNNSIKHSTSRYIAFCDSDDMWKPNKLEHQLKFMEANDYALTYSNYDTMDEQGNLNGNIKSPPKVSYRIMLRNNYIGCLTAMYDTQKLGKVYMPSIRRRQDWALWLSILKRTEYAYGINDRLSIYRIRKHSTSSNKVLMLKYNWNIYKNVEKFGVIKSAFLLTQFLCYYMIKKI